ncbi:Protein kinase rad3 [Smittium mucronatum]|uniref:non-specific serine/threonine protein kinase n=1 Tax=Smittium mucronatum TaxID=133383 RepID=A0A1R0H4H5_9FUNG|nr:Protein kinase rad3 [Smittium mucronatum]
MQSSLQTYLNILASKSLIQDSKSSNEDSNKEKTYPNFAENSNFAESSESNNNTVISVSSLLKSCSVKLAFELVSEIGNTKNEVSLRAQSALIMVIQSIFGNNFSKENEYGDLTVQDVCTQINTQSRINKAQGRQEKIKKIFKDSSSCLIYSQSKNEFLNSNSLELGSLEIKKFTQRCLLGLLASVNELFESNPLQESIDCHQEYSERSTNTLLKMVVSLRFLFQIIGKFMKKHLSSIVKTLIVPIKNPYTSLESLITYSVLIDSLKDANLSINNINCLISPLVEISLIHNTDVPFFEHGSYSGKKLGQVTWEIINDSLVHIIAYNHSKIRTNWFDICPVPNFNELKGSRALYIKLSKNEISVETIRRKSNQNSKEEIIKIDASSSQSSSDEDSRIEGPEKDFYIFDTFLFCDYDKSFNVNKELEFKTFSDFEYTVSIIQKMEILIHNSDIVISTAACLEMEAALKTIYLSKFILDNLKDLSISNSFSAVTKSEKTQAILSDKFLPANGLDNSSLFEFEKSFVLNLKNYSKQYFSDTDVHDSEIAIKNYSSNDKKDLDDSRNSIRFIALLTNSIINVIKKHGGKNRFIDICCGRLLGLLGLCNERVQMYDIPTSIPTNLNYNLHLSESKKNSDAYGLFNLFFSDGIIYFVRYIIVNHLAPLLISFRSPFNQLCLAYSIQELLKICLFSSLIPPKRADTFYIPRNSENLSSDNRNVEYSVHFPQERDELSQDLGILRLPKEQSGSYRAIFNNDIVLEVWESLPENISELISPLLESRYLIETDLNNVNYIHKNEIANNFQKHDVDSDKNLQTDPYAENRSVPKSNWAHHSLDLMDTSIISIFETSTSFEFWIQSWLLSLINIMPKNSVSKIFLACSSSISESPIELSIAILRQAILYISTLHHYNNNGISVQILSSFLFSGNSIFKSKSTKENEILTIQNPNYQFKCSSGDLFYHVYKELKAVFDPNLNLVMSSECRKKSIRTILNMFDYFHDYIRKSPLSPNISLREASLHDSQLLNSRQPDSLLNSSNSEDFIMDQLNLIENNLKSSGKSFDKADPLKNFGGNLTILQLVLGSAIPFDKMAISAMICGEYQKSLLFMEKFSKMGELTEESQMYLLKFSLLVYVMLFDIDGIIGCSNNLWKKGIDPNELITKNSLTDLKLQDSSLDPIKFIQSKIDVDPTRIFRAFDTRDWSNSLFRYESNLQVNPNDSESQLGWINCQQNMGQWNVSLSSGKNWLLETESTKSERESLLDLCAASAWRLGAWDFDEELAKNVNNSANSMKSSKTLINASLDNPYNFNASVKQKDIFYRFNQPEDLSNSMPESFNRSLLYIFSKFRSLLENYHQFNNADSLLSNLLKIKSYVNADRYYVCRTDETLSGNIDSLSSSSGFADMDSLNSPGNSKLIKPNSDPSQILFDQIYFTWLQLMRSARTGNCPSAAISTMFRFKTLSNSLDNIISSNCAHNISPNLVHPLSSCFFKNDLLIEKAKIMYECGLSSQHNVGMNEMQSVVENTISSLVLNEKVFGNCTETETNFIKAYKLNGLSGTLSDIIPSQVNLDLYKNDPIIYQEIKNLGSSNVLNLTSEEIKILKKILKPLTEQEISLTRLAYLEAGMSVLEWKTENGLITQNGVSKKFEGILAVQDNLKSHYMIAKVYDTMLTNAKEHLLSEKLNQKESSSKNVKTLSMLKDFPDLLRIGSNSSFIVPLQSSLIPIYPSFKQKDGEYTIYSNIFKNNFNHNSSESKPSRLTSKSHSSASSGAISFDSEYSYNTASQQAAASNYVPFPHDLPTISSFNDEILVMSSLQKPKKITIVGSDGITYAFLCKPKDDLRKDARQMEFNSLINQVLSDDVEASKRSLKIKTYAVVPLNEDCGIIQWVPNTVSIQQTVGRLFVESGIQINTSVIKGLLNTKTKTPELHFKNNVLNKYPPVLYKWFMKRFKTPEEWIKSRKTFSNSAAVMSMVGYIVGLGDRHCENILLDQMTGGVLHVDFSCLFDKGTKLEVPEKVPFRLTQNMVDAMGAQGYEGSFRTSSEITMRLLRTHREALKSVLDTFINDPLVEWSNLSNKKNEYKHELIEEAARQALGKIGTKLDGFYHSSYIPVSGQVDELIKEATDPINLMRMYIGWAPYI